MAILKIKNGTPGTYIFGFRDPLTNKKHDKIIIPMSTEQVYSGDLDMCAAVRLQYPIIPDNDDSSLKDASVQFLWEGILPTLDDYLGSLETAELESSIASSEIMQKTVNEVANLLPNEKSGIQVATVGKKKPIEAKGREAA
jgi:hypothetical protein